MLCQKCQKENATMHYTENINGKVREMHLCPACAKGVREFEDRGFGGDWFADMHQNFMRMMAGDPWQGALGLLTAEDSLFPQIEERPRAPKKLLKKVKKAAEPKPLKDTSAAQEEVSVDTLRARMYRAVQEENFEEAARLRDEIKKKTA